MFRMMKSLGITHVKNLEELEILMATVIYFNFSVHPSTWQMIQLTNRIFKVEILKCFTYENIKSVGAEKKYKCACFAIRSGFFKALDLDVEQECKKSLMSGDPNCEIIFKVKKWRNNSNISPKQSNLIDIIKPKKSEVLDNE